MGKHQRTDRNSDIPMGGNAPEPTADPVDSTLNMPRVDAPETTGRFFGKRVLVGIVAAGVVGLAALAAGTVALGGASPAASATDKGAGNKPAAARPHGDRNGSDRSAKAAEKAKAAKEQHGNKGDKAGQAAASPSHVGLCRAYASKVRDGYPGKALESTAFASLIKAAGGSSGVQSYCTRVLAQKQADREGNADENRGKGKENGQGKSQEEHGNSGGK